MPIVVTRESKVFKTDKTVCQSIDEAKALFDTLVKEAAGLNDGVKRTHSIVITPDSDKTFDGTVKAVTP